MRAVSGDDGVEVEMSSKRLPPGTEEADWAAMMAVTSAVVVLSSVRSASVGAFTTCENG